MKQFLFFVAFIVLLAITSSCNTIVEPDVVEIIMEDRETGQKQIVTDKDSIKEIVSTINSSNREFCIFIPQKEMTLKYKSKNSIKYINISPLIIYSNVKNSIKLFKLNISNPFKDNKKS